MGFEEELTLPALVKLSLYLPESRTHSSISFPADDCCRAYSRPDVA